MIKISNKVTGNNCACCHNTKGKDCHITIWIKADNEKRGHNYPICSEKCKEEFLKKLKEEGIQ